MYEMLNKLSSAFHAASLAQRQRRRLLDYRERDRRAHRLHARNPREVIEEERLVRFDVTRHDAQEKIPLAEHGVALEHFRMAAHGLLEFGERFPPVVGELHVRKDHEIETELFAVEQRDARAD